MAVARYFSSIAQPTTLAGGISNANLTMQVTAVTGFPTSYPFTLAVDYGTSAEELVDVTNASGTTLTITRAADGTSAQSHSIGAVVRHVSSARDFADFQTHAAATAGVHGVSGTLVGTSDAQTLANKTLTTPSISGATTSGTWTGSPTFSGNLTFTGAPGFRGASTSASALATRVSIGDTTDRLIVSADGTHTWGPGNAVGDVTLGRTGLLALRTNGSLQSSRLNATDVAFSAQVSTDTVERFRAYADGKHEWGPGGSTARDAVLYRNAAGELKTDTAFTATGNLSGGNFPAGAWPAWTPAWSTSTGLHSPSYGNAGVLATYQKVGRSLYFSVSINFGSTTTFGTSVTTNDNWQFLLPAGLLASTTFRDGNVMCGMGRATAGGGATIPVMVRADSTGANFVLDTAGGRQDGAAITNSGTLDSLTPWNWTSNNVIQFSGAVEVTT